MDVRIITSNTFGITFFRLDLSKLENNAQINYLMLFSITRKLNEIVHLFSIKTILVKCKL